jgi:hypothetical protein
VPTIFHTTLPDDADHDQIVRDLEELAAGVVLVEIQPASRSGRGGKLGQIDPNLVDIVVRLLDTETVATIAQSTISGFVGYLLAKSGKKPLVEERLDRDKNG